MSLPRLLPACLPALLAGCVHLHEPDPTAWRPTDDVPHEMKSCVFVFLVEPLNPLEGQGLRGIDRHVREAGFCKTYLGRPAHLTYFAEKMRWLSGQCASPRFAVIASGSAANEARRLAGEASREGLPVDLVVYVEPGGGPDGWVEVEAPKTFTVRAADYTGPDGKPVSKGAVSTHPEVLALLDRELTRVGLAVPPPARKPVPAVVLVEPMPPPRETPPRPRPLPEEWKFLCPRHPYDIPPRPGPGPEALPLPKPLPKAEPPELPPPAPRLPGDLPPPAERP